MLCCWASGCVSSEPTTSTLTTSTPSGIDVAHEGSMLMLTPDEIPPAGEWSAGGPTGGDYFRQVICGVDNEPVAPEGSFDAQRVSPEDRPLHQTVRPVGADQAQETYSALAEALPQCTEDTRTTNSGETQIYTVQPIQLDSADTVAWAEAPSSNPAVWVVRAYFVESESLVAFATMAQTPDEATAILDGCISAVRTKAKG